MKKAIVWMLALCVMTLVSGCGGEEVEVVDLNKVLDALIATLDELKDKPAEGVPEQPAETAGESAEGTETAAAETDSGIKPVESAEGEQENMKLLLATYTKKLNEAKIVKKPVGVQMAGDGSIEGFEDPNTNSSRDGKEKKLFKVEIDAERNRLIATDVQRNYRRDSMLPSLGMGLVAGYCLSRMLGRQRGAGITGSRFRNMKMSPRNYHKGAVSSARAKSGSRSFKGGK